MLISVVQQRDTVVHTYIFPFIFSSFMVYHRILNIVPCAMQQELVEKHDFDISLLFAPYENLKEM